MIKLKSLLSEIYVFNFTKTHNQSKFRQPENFDKISEDNGWIVKGGGNDWENGMTWAAMYFEGQNKEAGRIWFEIKYPSHFEALVGENLSPDHPSFSEINEWGKKAIRRWIAEARKIRYNTRTKYIPDATRWSYKDWSECFIEAFNSPKMKPYVKNWGLDQTNWSAMKKCSENDLH